MTGEFEVEYVPYQQHGEPTRKAAIARIDFNLDGFPADDIQVLGHLSDAVNGMNPVYRHQFESQMPVLRDFIQDLIAYADPEPEQRKALENYRTLLDVQNAPFDLVARKNHLLPLEREAIGRLVKKAPPEVMERFEEVQRFLFDDLSLPPTANLYPTDITDEEFRALGKRGNIVNSSVLRMEGRPSVLLNEIRYSPSLRPVITSLQAARDICRDPSFRMYLDAKILELTTGAEESRRLSDYTWINHNSDIDLVLSTANEVYLDKWKNLRGGAAGAVMIKNREAESLLQALKEQLPALEANAPWEYRKEDMDPDKLPKLRFVDVLNWDGDYVNSPITIVAQSLPNDEWTKQNVGSVNLVYRNIGKAVHRITERRLAEELFTRADYERYIDRIFDAGQLHFSQHELGHTTGRMCPEIGDRNPNEILGAEYSAIEEARAELFALYSLPALARVGIINEGQMNAGYYFFVLPVLSGLRFQPKQDHVKAHNMIFHYMLERGAIETVEEEGKTKYRPNITRMCMAVPEMLAEIARIKSNGLTEAAKAFRESYCFTDERRAEFQERMHDLPVGRGFIFPELERDGDRYTGKLFYPASFSDQRKFSLPLLK